MKVLKVNLNNLAEKYRNNRLYKHTPDIERYLYTKRSGSITELQNKFTKEQIETAHIINKIKTHSDHLFLFGTQTNEILCFIL